MNRGNIVYRVGSSLGKEKNRASSKIGDVIFGIYLIDVVD